MYTSRPQLVRVLSENWISGSGYCPACLGLLESYPNNNPAADFRCHGCTLDFELKSKAGKFGRKAVDGAFSTMMRRINCGAAPNLFLLSYQKPIAFDKPFEVTELQVIPSFALHARAIECRRPLGPTARRPGWTGCNILLEALPKAVRVSLVKNGLPTPRQEVQAKWKNIGFLNKTSISQRSWLTDIMKCIDRMGCRTFSLSEIYGFESQLAAYYPNNNNIRAKIRQQLQRLRDNGYLCFLGNGRYEVCPPT
ncbi:MAG TPA: DpnI domain-containing protein [Rhodanobacteraceae bacterium]|nr:DpnI domain-containing protein [Rhodanobacteraceae bacterium]